MNNKKSCRLSSTCYFVRLNAYTNVYTLLYVEKRVKLNPRTTDCSLSELIVGVTIDRAVPEEDRKEFVTRRGSCGCSYMSDEQFDVKT